MPVRAAEFLIDPGSFRASPDGLITGDPLGFPGYEEELAASRRGGADEAVVTGAATIGGHEVEVALFDFSFFAGSMGEVVGERTALALERAARRKVPFVLRTETGGARMQEGMRALIQMPKLLTARLALSDADQPLIAVFGHPTTGGVLASLGAMADVTIAEAGATIGFAGPRLVERFTGRSLREDSHTAFAAMGSGLVDAIVAPEEARSLVHHALSVLADDEPAEVPEPVPMREAPEHPDPWEAVTAARAEDRPHAPELLSDICDALFYLRGDRAGGEDLGITTAFARVAGRRAVVIALERSTPPGPAGYRKACRCVDLAARLGIPVVTLIDTPGADPSESSEAGGIAWAIAETFRKVLMAPVPVLAIVTGEGGSGGALAFATSDVLLAYGNSIFSVIGPEAAADILWHDPSRAAEAARDLRLTAPDLLRLGIADGLIPEPLEGESLRRVVAYHLGRFSGPDWDRGEMIRTRRDRWRGRGERQASS